MPVTIFYY